MKKGRSLGPSVGAPRTFVSVRQVQSKVPSSDRVHVVVQRWIREVLFSKSLCILALDLLDINARLLLLVKMPKLPKIAYYVPYFFIIQFMLLINILVMHLRLSN